MTSDAGAADLVFDQAAAISRTVPLKAGRSKATSALPSGADFTTPEKQRQRRLRRLFALHLAARRRRRNG